jgi:hypothetical protein
MQTPAVKPAEALATLKPSNEPISSETFAKAKELLGLLAALDAPAPFIFPTEDGGISFEWRGGSHEADIEVLPDKPILACARFENGKFVDERDLKVTKEDLLAILNWMR